MRLNAYEVLGVSQMASERTIKKAWIKRIQTVHPDINNDGNAEVETAKINAAYTTIKKGGIFFLFNETPAKQHNTVKTAKQHELDVEKREAIKKIESFNCLHENEKKFYKQKISQATTTNQIKRELIKAATINNYRESVRYKAILEIEEYRYLSENEKNSYKVRISTSFSELGIYEIVKEARETNTLNQIKSFIIDIVMALSYMDRNRKKEYISMIGRAVNKSIVEQIFEAAKKEDEELKKIQEAKKTAIAQVKELYFEKNETRQEFIDYIKNCTAEDEIERTVNIAKKMSVLISSTITKKIERVIRIYEQSVAISGQLIASYTTKIRACKTIEELDAYETALDILEQILVNINFLTIGSIISELQKAIDTTENELVKQVLRAHKRHLEDEILISQITEEYSHISDICFNMRTLNLDNNNYILNHHEEYKEKIIPYFDSIPRDKKAIKKIIKAKHKTERKR